MTIGEKMLKRIILLIMMIREGNIELLNCLEALLWQQQGLSIQEISEKIGKNYAISAHQTVSHFD